MAGDKLWIRALVCSLLSNACAFGPGRVTRVADGVAYEGRYVPAEAYSAYARGAVAEARGDHRGALQAYEEALSEDRDAAEIFVRLGAVLCAVAGSPMDRHAREARSRLALAVRLQPELSSAWFETARCQARLREPSAALTAALEAARLDPSSARCTLLVVELAERTGDLERARLWLDAWVVRTPPSREAWLAMRDFAVRQRDGARRHRAEQALSKAAPTTGEAALERALHASDLVTARSAATQLRIPASELALRAVALGALEAASQQAELVMSADPDDADAWVAALAVADLRRDRVAFTTTLQRAPLTPSPLGSLALELLDELIRRKAGHEAAAERDASSPP